jgi:cytidylate kinase
MYRALTLKVLDSHIDIQDIPAIIRTANNTKINLTNKDDKTLAVFLDGKDVSSEIRQPRITKFVSDIARIKEVREVMLGLQRELGKKSNSILDGRDIGTVVFPDADKKFYLDAKFDERTKRRYKELKGTGQQITSEDVAKDLSNRDKIDSTREHAPLKQAEDAIYIDTTDMTIEEVAETLIKHIGALDVNSH